MSLLLQQASEDVLLEKYAKGSEQKLPGDQALAKIRLRVAKALAQKEKDPEYWEDVFLKAQESGLIMAGRVNSAAGAGIDATLINCFVQPIGDSIRGEEDGLPGIYPALEQAAETMRRGGGVGYDFSKLRPSRATVALQKNAADKVDAVGAISGTLSSGPCAFLRLFDASCASIESAGARRGAQMGVLRVDHPDIRDFIVEKASGSLKNFNVSVAVTDEFMRALTQGERFQLVHKAKPSDDQVQAGAVQRTDGFWVYEDKVDAREIWDLIMQNTYNQAEPGVLFIDRINTENNLNYCEVIEATNPCGEQPLPDYACCCLGSQNLCAYVNYINGEAEFDWNLFKKNIHTAIRMLDNVLDVSYWPLPEQQQEAANKRRVGLGITGLGSTLVMLKLKYDSQEGLDFAEKIACVLRDESYRASVNLAKEKGAFPLFDKNAYGNSPFIKRMPKSLQKEIKEHGVRNSHLLSIAPTGTISLTIANNVSNGIEPAFSYVYKRNKRAQDGSTISYTVMDHAYRMYIENGGDEHNLPAYFVNALNISPSDHVNMVAVFADKIDSAISKTINCPEDISFEDFKSVYQQAYDLGLKGVTTFRPNPTTGAVLETLEAKNKIVESADRRVRLDKLPEPALKSLRWPRRPECPDGNGAMTYMVQHPSHPFAVFIGHIENGKASPFEVWVNGEEQPRGLGALAKSLSMDMRATGDRAWLKAKLDSLKKTSGVPFEMALPRQSKKMVASEVSALALLVEHRCNELGVFENIEGTPLIDAMMSKREPKSGTDGTLSWTVDVNNPSTGDDFALFLKELELPDGSKRPYSVWLSGSYPQSFNGLTKALSLDMRIVDLAWVSKKLQSLSNIPEAQGDFLARVPGQDHMETQPSTLAYVARLIQYRYRQLGLFNRENKPVVDLGIFSENDHKTEVTIQSHVVLGGKRCPECHVDAVIKLNGCDNCTACGYLGSCG